MYAIARFGSTCRTDADQLSDQDLLIVCHFRRKARLLRKYRGYSVSFFTERQLMKMQEKGSLFLQHLKIESQIVVDADGEFQQFIDACNFIPPEENELIQCERALKTVLAWPNDPRTDSWKSDWLYCLLRDYLVKRLAAKGVLVFGVGDISNAAKKEWNLFDKQLRCLKELRFEKVAYRESRKNENVRCDLFSEAKCLLDAVGLVGPEVPIEYPVGVGSLDRFLNTDYQWLRALEGLYILAQSAGYTHPCHENLMKLIQRPNLYHSSSRMMHAKVCDYYSDVVSAVTASGSMRPSTHALHCAKKYTGVRFQVPENKRKCT